MSANEKDLRTTRQAERKERKSAAAAEKEKKDRSFRRNAVIIIAIFVVLIIAALLINSNIFYTKTTALTIGTTKYSPAEVSYFYHSTYNSMYQEISNSYGDYISLVLDTSKPLSEQLYPFDESGMQTWEEAVIASSQEDMVKVTAFYDAALKAGRSITEEERASIDASIQSFKDYAKVSGYNDPDKFFAAYFGKGVDESLVRKLQERITIASNYSIEVQNSFSYTDEELTAYYAEHTDSLDYYVYYGFPVYGSMDQFSDIEEDDKSEYVRAAADEIVAATTDVESFLNAVKAFNGENTKLAVTASHPADISSFYKDWITDPARQPGDITVVDAVNTSYVLYYIGFDNNDYNTVDFRHILIKAVADEDGNYSEEALTAAREKAEELLAQWQEDPTEDHFAEMANENSEDNGSNSTGGLYEMVAKNTMVPGVNDFLFNEGHVVGDTGIVFGESTAYTGYHVMYFAGENRRNSYILAEDAKRIEDFDAKSNELTAPYTVTEGSGLRFVGAI